MPQQAFINYIPDATKESVQVNNTPTGSNLVNLYLIPNGSGITLKAKIGSTAYVLKAGGTTCLFTAT